MSLTSVAIRRPVFSWMAFAGLLLFGGIAFDRLGVSLLPDVDFPNITVSADLPGAAPEVIEKDVVDVLEGALSSVPGVVAMTSTARQGSGSVSLELSLGQSVDSSLQEVQAAVSRSLRALPEGMQIPYVRKMNPEDDPILWLSVASDTLSRRELMGFVRDRVRDRLQTVEGVSEIGMGGYVDPNVRVWLSEEKLRKFQFSAMDVVQAIQQEHSEKPGGWMENQRAETPVRILGEARDIREFAELSLSRRGGAQNFAPVPLRDVARIELGLNDERSLVRAQGKSAISLGIKKQPGVNAVSVARAVQARAAEIRKTLPPEISLETRFDQTQFIREAVSELLFTLLLSAVLTAVVCWIFLGSWGATVNVILSIPTSVLGTLIVLMWQGFTLNTFTLLGLSLAIGIVVDDAIMVLENILRHRRLGKSASKAALEGTHEIAGAAFAATLAIIAIFIPVLVMQGVVGRYLYQFGITLSVAVAISLFEALTLTPMRLSRTQSDPRERAWIRRVGTHYLRLLKRVLAAPRRVVAVATVVSAALLAVGVFLPREFVPAQDQSRLMVRLSGPSGASLAWMDRKAKEVEAFLRTQKEVQSVFASVGAGMGGPSNSGFMLVTLVPAVKRKRSVSDLIAAWRGELKKIDQLKAFLQDPSLSSFGGRRSYPAEISIQGPDWVRLQSIALDLMKRASTSPYLVDLDNNLPEISPELQVVPNRAKARQYGVAVGDISRTVQLLIAGEVVAKFSDASGRQDVRVSLESASRNDPEVMNRISVRNQSGELIPLRNVVDIDQARAVQSITREDRMRAVRVRANIASGQSQGKAIEDLLRLARQGLPAGYSAVPAGSAKTLNETFSGLGWAILLGVLVAYMVLASQFNRYALPAVVLYSLPISMGGAFFTLWITGQKLNLFSMIGIVLLMGLAKKNAILLVEFAQQLREEGHSAYDAAIGAGEARLRPILMTSVATLAGALPAALAWGPGAESRIPMAIPLLGGIFASTLMTVFAIPALYLWAERGAPTSSRVRG